ncbi:hypothetical protein V494_05126 [Pseudogymnoascus sp. VKM F-4513 (FW-928)]|nr:hypothetical protein V494_05126 [Pseudogymnoascus sp. VKM F-4513 (FW-928)]
MPIRNPFAKRTGLEGLPDENTRPGSPGGQGSAVNNGDIKSSKASSALSINGKKVEQPPEYKMSVVNDSGVYLPPSPPEKKSFWPRRSNPSNASSSTTTSFAEIEPFSISRESFDSYRRSFDISARSPVMESSSSGRQSLDARLPRLPRSSFHDRRFEGGPPTTEEEEGDGFEDVGLNDNPIKDKPAPKKKGFFSRLGDQGSDEPALATPLTSRFHFTNRKRGLSGQGAELGNMERPMTASSQEVTEVR